MEGMKALKITFKSNKLGKICTDSSVTRKTYNLEMAEKIAQRMEELEAADLVFEKVKNTVQIVKILEIEDYH